MSGTRRPAAFNDDAAAALERTQQAAPAADSLPESGPGPRPARRPFGARDQKLAYPPRPGFHRHWFNDEPGRIQRAGEAGYAHVKDDKSHQNVQSVVGTARGGGSLVAFLMEIPEEWYQEDMAAGEALNLERKREIQQGKVGRPGGRDGDLQYVAENLGGISLREADRR